MSANQVATVSAPTTPVYRTTSRQTAVIIAALCGVRLILHLLVNGRYSFFRDELYYIACSKHLAWGYADQPPMIALVVRAARMLFGDSLLGLRMFAALSMLAVIALTILIAREMGGGKFAQWLAGICIVVGPIWLSFGYLMTMNSIEHVIWTACAYLIVRYINTRNPQLWLWFGVLCGLGLETKYSISVFGAGVVVALLLTRERRVFFDKWIWIGGAAALLIFLPNLIWNVHYDWPFVQIMHNIRAEGRDVVLSPPRFWIEQLILTLPIAGIVWIAGLIWTFFNPYGKRYRVLGITFLFVTFAFMFMHGKNYYSTPIYPVMFAAGGVAIGTQWTGRWRAAAWVLTAAIIAMGVAVSPMAVPVLSVDNMIVYLEHSPMQPPKSEHSHERSILPQTYSDQFGWPEITAAAAQAWNQIPASERKDCAIFGQDYGVAGAIDFYGAKYGLPPALSGHQNYYIWGPRGYSGNCMIVIDDSRENLEKLFEDVQYVTTSAPNKYALETELPVYICRRAKFGSLEKAWPKIKKWG